MRLGSRADLDRDRLLRLFALVLAGTIALLLVVLVPEYVWLLPDSIRNRPIVMAWIGLAAAYGLARAFVRARPRRSRDASGECQPPGLPDPDRGRSHPDRPAEGPLGTESRARDRVARILGRIDAIADLALSGGLSVGVGAACLAFVATWLPHYLIWPWHRDADTFATLARCWDAGILPYRDIRAYNFPGTIYLHWLLARTFGWGRTWPLYAFDASCFIGLGLALAAWSRRTLGGVFPGLASYLVFLTYYLSLDYQLAAGRDWHTGLCIAIGLMALQGWPGRASRIVAAALAAAALSIRPHAILFLPALASAVLEGSGGDAEGSPAGRTSPGRRLAAWLILLGGFTAIAFAPVIVAGIADDLVRGFRVAAYGGPYNRASLATVSQVIVEEWNEYETPIVVGMMVLVLAATRGTARRRAVTWALALAAAFLYRPIHPVQHRYLGVALDLIGTISMAPAFAWILDLARVAPVYRAVAAIVLIAEVSLGLPTFSNPRAAVRAMADLARGETIPVESPPGSWVWFNLCNGRFYPWEDYRNVLLYLRARTTPDMVVANALKLPPFPAINGPTGCLSPFRAESGICWMYFIPIDLEPEFATELERAKECLVVWAPEEHSFPSQLRIDRIVSVIRAHYRPEARFGRIEVWRRADREP